MYQLIGGELSPYTAKVRFYLRHKNIAFEPVQATAEVYMNFVRPRVGWNIIPVLVTPEKDVIQDSTDIISILEKRHPSPSVLPQTPKQKIISLLLEMFVDEWIIMPVMHYRWSFPENLPFLKEEFGRIGFPSLSVQDRNEVAEKIYSKFKGFLPIIGITDKSRQAIEESWKALLDELTAHFDKHPYFLGGKPCVGDFAFAGMAYAHLYRDPVPGYLMKTRAPLVAAWVENMNGHLPHANKLSLHEVTEDGWLMREDLPEDSRDFCAGGDIPATLFPILTRFFTEFGPILRSAKSYVTKYIQQNVTPNQTKIPRSIGIQEYSIGGIKETRGVFPFSVWKWQRIIDFYCSLPFESRVEADRLMVRFPFGLEIIKANLDDCRVERVNNFLHAAKRKKSHL
ncbi:uncharacterized protein LOC143449028 [Clavelina lepadiformis]|uniref:uncharacterized protein LOC143449028 n=1 Tax=Clavelina lepadiformis TaxID=159417 RepID=UPI0040411F91